jgi:L-alanine-DL-glutamate epimerase-like enolase superfamily enzyme
MTAPSGSSVASAELRAVRWHQQPRGPAIWRAVPLRQGLLLRVIDGEGYVGIGEASPLPMAMPTDGEADGPDELAEAERALQRWAPRWSGASGEAELAVRSPDQAYRVAEAACPASPAARFALETALLDLLAARRGCSLAELLVPAGSAPASSVPLNAVVDSVEAASAAWARGITTLKLKLGLDTDADARLLRALRAAIPASHLRLRGDANRGWPLAETRDRLAALAFAELDYVEEPCRELPALLAASSSWPAALPPIALDESAAERSADELRALLVHPRVAALIVKPTRLGGLLSCQRWAALAATSGKRTVVTHTLEGPVAMAACAELARALAPGNPELAVGLDVHPGLAAWPLPVPQLTPSRVEAQPRPGLALTTPWSELLPSLDPA